jgi:hypothetical protein
MEITPPRISIAIPTACCTAVVCFAVSVLAGVAVDNPAGAILARSLGVMLVGWPVGLVAGVVLERLFREQADAEALQAVELDSTSGGLEDDVEIIDEDELESDGSTVVSGESPLAA